MEVEIGKIVGIWGVKGWVKLHSFTRSRADIAQYKNWWLKPIKKARGIEQNSNANEGPFTSVKVLNCKEQGKGIVAQLEGVNDPDQALTLNGHSIWVNQSDLPALPSGEFYWQQLIGLMVSTKDSLSLGTVESILETGANDVLVIRVNQGSLSAEGSLPAEGSLQAEGSIQAEGSELAKGTEILVPYADRYIDEINIEQGTMIVDWDPSYLED